jgi:hypothetical protein
LAPYEKILFYFFKFFLGMSEAYISQALQQHQACQIPTCMCPW